MFRDINDLDHQVSSSQNNPQFSAILKRQRIGVLFFCWKSRILAKGLDEEKCLVEWKGVPWREARTSKVTVGAVSSANNLRVVKECGLEKRRHNDQIHKQG
ncbi:hypothetical protein TNCT_115831 [Trichonephila clavata]|uniref:Uncharacterized protein n=1 Tax=Trichonephila clavata TaxID=2740835 RepID=A0A8X6IQI2_TRICU|nr:hypothetical protein TNCT_115831 [Trichonephila clavata]